MKQAKPHRPRHPAPKSSGAAPGNAAKLNQATADEFEQEGLGVASKE